MLLCSTAKYGSNTIVRINEYIEEYIIEIRFVWSSG